VTATELREMLVAGLARSAGGGRQRWRKAVAEVKTYPLSTHPHCNWEVRAAGTASEIAIVERAVDRVRMDYPHVERG
jgi:hypothetical protein